MPDLKPTLSLVSFTEKLMARHWNLVYGIYTQNSLAKKPKKVRAAINQKEKVSGANGGGGPERILLRQQRESLKNGFEREMLRKWRFHDTFVAGRRGMKMEIYFRQRQSGEMQKVSRKLSKH